MDRNASWKWLLLGIMILLSLLRVFLPLDKPLSEKIPLGLDLRGGVSMTLEVDRQAVAEECRDKADPAATEEEINAQIRDAMRDAQMRALQVVRNRIDAAGTREPNIYPEKGSNRIVVQIPGVGAEQRDQIEEELKQVAFLSFHLVHKDSQTLSRDLITSGKEPKGFKVIYIDNDPYLKRDWEQKVDVDFGDPFAGIRAPSAHMFRLRRTYLHEQKISVYEPVCLKRKYEFSGEVLKDAKGDWTPMGQRYIELEFNGKGRKIFARVTEDYAPRGDRNLDSDVGRQLAIMLDDVVRSSPVIKQKIPGGRARIDGHFPGDEADRLARVLRTGSLPAPIAVVNKRTVDPSLGQDSIESGLSAIAIGGILVVVFMMAYYRLSGVVANVALLLNLLMLPLGMIAVSGFFGIFVGATRADNAFDLPVLTLPGIAGILLAIGMAVDANVLIFERMREEFASGKRLWAAIKAGYDRALVTIVDANLTTLLAGVILFFCGGSGPIRGFSVTLCAGILLSMFTALVVTRLLFDVLAHKYKIERLSMLQIVRNPKINFVNKRVFCAVLSLAVIAGTWGVLVTRGVKDETAVLGVDFTGGAAVTFRFEDKKPVEDVRDTLASAGVPEAQIQYQTEMDGSAEYLVVKTASQHGATVKDALTKTFAAAGYKMISEVQVARQVGKELQERATWAIVIALGVMILYISWRFEFGFAVGAIVALAHDVLITVGIYSLLGNQLSLPIVAALLTIVGYSVNDTIVVFDRIREDLKLMQNESFVSICNLSINQTLSRTLLTSVTTLITVLMLLIFGGGAIRDFALALCIGVLVGTYSSIFVATPVVLLWHRDRKPAFAAGAGGKR